MNVDTARFGTLMLKSEDILEFPGGILGFPDLKRFFILDHNTPSPFRWLQSADDPNIAFVIIDPSRVIGGTYQVRLTEREQVLLYGNAVRNDNELLFATIANVTDPRNPTVNLLAPLCICATTRIGLQTVQHHSGLSARHPLGQRKNSRLKAA